MPILEPDTSLYDQTIQAEGRRSTQIKGYRLCCSMGIPNTILLQQLAFQAPSPPLACPGPTSNSLTAEASVVLKFVVVLD